MLVPSGETGKLGGGVDLRSKKVFPDMFSLKHLTFKRRCLAGRWKDRNGVQERNKGWICKCVKQFHWEENWTHESWWNELREERTRTEPWDIGIQQGRTEMTTLQRKLSKEKLDKLENQEKKHYRERQYPGREMSNVSYRPREIRTGLRKDHLV